jgi:carbonic anhydrase/acetyltransferase-like protein (isoleucine patch superfamily)
VLFGAIVTAEDGSVEIGARCVNMENALLRGRAAHPVSLGDDVLVGPHAHVNGAEVGEGCFLATGCSLFPGSRLGASAIARASCRRTSTTRSGRSRRASISRRRCTACHAALHLAN